MYIYYVYILLLLLKLNCFMKNEQFLFGNHQLRTGTEKL